MPKPKITLQPDPKLKGKKYPRKGPVTKVETALVAQVVLDQPGGIKSAQVTALAKALNRPVDMIKVIVEEARTKFVKNVDRYVDIHMQAAEGALIAEDFETATKAAQWYLANIAHDGARVIEKVASESSGTKIMIGLKVGGKNENTPIEAVLVKE